MDNTRNQSIIKVSITGITVNVLLSAVKAFIGIISNSIAITLDAVNNLSDAFSSIVTIIGAKLSGKKPDKKHPFGHGRVEYLSASVISFIIIYAGIAALYKSIKTVIFPEVPNYAGYTPVIVAVGVVVKFVLGTYYERKGRELKSDSLIASGKDAKYDALVSLSTLIAAIVFILFHISIEAYLGILISVLMIRSGIDILRETISQILGERPMSDNAKAVKDIVNSFPEVYGVYDLVLHNYGPDYLTGSLHIEVPEEMTVAVLDRLERDIVDKVYTECSVIITGISVYGMNSKNDESARIRDEIRRCVMSHEYVLQMHGFYISTEEKKLQLDVVIGFDAPDRNAVYEAVVKEISEKCPDYDVRVGFDSDLSD